MASDDLDLDLDSEDEDAAPKSKKMMIIIIIGVVLLLIVGIAGGLFATGFFDDAEQSQSEQTAAGEDGAEAGNQDSVEEQSTEFLYWALEPAFVLNFEGKSKARYMQVGLELVTTSNKAYVGIKKHMPVIRSEIVLLLSGQKYEEMVTPEGKEQLRAEIMEVINGILTERKIKSSITNIYFTSFVMQ